MLFVQQVVKTTTRSYCSHLKTFLEIPGPKPWPLVGNSLLFSPLGPYKVTNLLDGFADLKNKYGDIIKLKMGNQDMLLVFNPDDIRTMFKHEGKYPKRPTFEALKQYRKGKYQAVGIVPDNGEEWYKMRQHVHILLKLKTVHSYWYRQQVVAEEFSMSLLAKRNVEGVVKDFIQEAFLYSLEAIGVVCYGKRLNCFSSNSNECDEIVKANTDFLEALSETFHQPPWWKIWKTKAYKTIETTQDFMMKITVNNLEEARHKLAEDPNTFAEEDPVIFHILENTHLSKIEKNLLITEIFQGGIDATGTVLTMMLYELARNSSIQTAIYEDLKKNKMQPGHNPQLLRACLKETLRLHPTAGGTSRILDSNAILSGYDVPKGTLVVGVSPKISRLECYFPNALQFDPWRWLDKTDSIHPYTTLPFGHGARMCPGRRFAEQEILLGVAEIILKYEILPVNREDVTMVLAMNLVPSEPIDFKLVVR